jgi:hypothetical protein
MAAASVTGNKIISLNFGHVPAAKECVQPELRRIIVNFIKTQSKSTAYHIKSAIKNSIETKLTKNKAAAAITSPQLLRKLIFTCIKPVVSCNFLLYYKLPHIG